MDLAPRTSADARKESSCFVMFCILTAFTSHGRKNIQNRTSAAPHRHEIKTTPNALSVSRLDRRHIEHEVCYYTFEARRSTTKAPTHHYLARLSIMNAKTICTRKCSTALDSLEKALGHRNAALLQAIPMAMTEVTEHNDSNFGRYISTKVLVGSIKDFFGARHELWSFMASEIRVGGTLPEVHYYGLHPTNGKYQPYPLQAVLANASLREEFQRLNTKKGELSVILQVCLIAIIFAHTDHVQTVFILSGAELPEKCVFTNAFLKCLRRASRRYNSKSDGVSPSSSSSQVSDPGRSSPVSPLKRVTSMRKSEKGGKASQRFEAIPRTPTSSGTGVGTSEGSCTLSQVNETSSTKIEDPATSMSKVL
jgi:hypothetical protein